MPSSSFFARRRSPAIDDTPQQQAITQEQQAVAQMDQEAAYQDLVAKDAKEQKARQTAIETERKKAAAAEKSKIAAMKRAGVATEVDPTGRETVKTHEDGTPLYKADWIGKPSVDDAGQARATFRDTRNQRHDIPLDAINRTTDAAGQSFYEFDVNGQRIRRPESPGNPLFKVDPATGRRYTEAQDEATGTFIQQPLGIDPRAANTAAIARKKADFERQKQKRTFDGQNLDMERTKAATDFEPVRERFTAAKTAAKKFTTGKRYEQGPDGLYAIDRINGEDFRSPIRSNDTKAIAAANSWLASKKTADDELSASRAEHDPAKKRLHDLEVQRNTLAEQALRESQRHQTEVADMEEAGKAGLNTAQPQWKTVLDEMRKNPRYQQIIAAGEYADHGSDLANVISSANASAKQKIAKQESDAKANWEKEAALHDSPLGISASILGEAARIAGDTAAEVVQQKGVVDSIAAGITNGKPQPDGKDIATARTIAAKSLGVADPDNWSLTPGSMGDFDLHHTGSEESLGRLDPDNKRITLFPTAIVGEAGKAMMSKASADGYPVYVMGGAEPMTPQELRDYVASAVAVARTAPTDDAKVSALQQTGVTPDDIRDKMMSGRISVQDAKWLNQKLFGATEHDNSREGYMRGFQDWLGQNPTAKAMLAKGTPEQKNAVVSQFANARASQSQSDTTLDRDQLTLRRFELQQQVNPDSKLTKAGNMVKEALVPMAGMLTQAVAYVPMKAAQKVGLEADAIRLSDMQGADWWNNFGSFMRKMNARPDVESGVDELRQWSVRARPGEQPPQELADKLAKAVYEGYHAYTPEQAKDRDTSEDSFNVNKDPTLKAALQGYLQTSDAGSLQTLLQLMLTDKKARTTQGEVAKYIERPRVATAADVIERAASLDIKLNEGAAGQLLALSKSLEDAKDAKQAEAILSQAGKILGTKTSDDTALAFHALTTQATTDPNSITGMFRSGFSAGPQEMATEVSSSALEAAVAMGTGGAATPEVLAERAARTGARAALRRTFSRIATRTLDAITEDSAFLTAARRGIASGRAKLGGALAKAEEDFAKAGMVTPKFGQPLSLGQKARNVAVQAAKTGIAAAPTEGAEEAAGYLGENDPTLTGLAEQTAMGALGGVIVGPSFLPIAYGRNVLQTRQANAAVEAQKAKWAENFNTQMSAAPGFKPMTPADFDVWAGLQNNPTHQAAVAEFHDALTELTTATEAERAGTLTAANPGAVVLAAQARLDAAQQNLAGLSESAFMAADELRQIPEAERPLYTGVAKAVSGAREFTEDEAKALIKLEGGNAIAFQQAETVQPTTSTANVSGTINGVAFKGAQQLKTLADLPEVTPTAPKRYALPEGVNVAVPDAAVALLAEKAPQTAALLGHQEAAAPAAANAPSTTPVATTPPVTKPQATKSTKSTKTPPVAQNPAATNMVRILARGQPAFADKDELTSGRPLIATFDATGARTGEVNMADVAMPANPQVSLNVKTLKPDNISDEQWADMATLNDAEQMAKYGTTRAKLAEQNITGAKPKQPTKGAPTPTGTEAIARRVIGEIAAKSKKLKGIISESKKGAGYPTGGMWMRADGTVAFHMPTLVEQLDGLDEKTAAQRVAALLDEEIRHAANIEAAKRLWKRGGTNPMNLKFEDWRDAWYADIWDNHFTPEMRAKVEEAYGDTIPEEKWQKAMEGLRMLDQLRATGSITESILRHLEAVLQALREFLDTASPKIKQEIEAIKNVLQEYGYEGRTGKVNEKKAKKQARKPKAKDQASAEPLSPATTASENQTQPNRSNTTDENTGQNEEGRQGQGRQEGLLNPPDATGAEGATPPAATTASKASIDKIKAAFDGLASAPAPATVEQVGLPKDRRAAFLDVADSLISDGVKTPKGLADALEAARPDGSLRKYSQALWDFLGIIEPALRGTHDWNAIYAKIDTPLPEIEEPANDITASNQDQSAELAPASELDKALVDSIIERGRKSFGNLPERFWSLYADLVQRYVIPTLTPEQKNMLARINNGDQTFWLSVDTPETLAIDDVADVYNYLIRSFDPDADTFNYMRGETDDFVVSDDDGNAVIALLNPAKFEGVEFGHSWSSSKGRYISVTPQDLQNDNTLAYIYTQFKNIHEAKIEKDNGTTNDPVRELILSPDSRAKKAQAMKKLAEERGETIKQTQEYVESRLVQIADEVAREGWRTPQDRFEELVGIYDKQPLFSARTSTSMENQAYSTPAPLAFAVRHMTGVTAETSVYDATAGNGMLEIGADLKNSVANEIDETRVAGLRRLGVGTITSNDATSPVGVFQNRPQAQSVHLNPPFGSIPNVNFDGYGIRKLEHIITLHALKEGMADNGTAAIILGATMNNQEQVKGAQWVFENYLYAHYNVVDNFEVSGDLYGNQGAKWPVRVLVIAGKKAVPERGQELAPKTVDRLDTWPDVWERAERTRNEVERQRQGLVTDGSSTASTGTPTGNTGTENPRPISSEQRPDDATTQGGGRSGGNTGGQSNAGTRGAGSSGLAPTGTVEQPTDAGNSEQTPTAGGKSASSMGGRGGRSTGGTKNASSRSPQNGGVTDTARTDRPDDGGVKRPERKKAKATDTQVPYDPASSGNPFETLVPRGISDPLQAALAEIVANRGPIDQYVADNLDMSLADLHKAMAAEQIDGVAMAIYQMETGGALIIGDETGIGKGRQAASLIRFAILKGKIPVFFTKDPKLFSDMWGDLRDIGTLMSEPNASASDLSVRPLVLGDAEKAQIKTPDNVVVLKPASNAKQNRIFAAARQNGFASTGHNAIFATYSQIRDPNERQAFLEWLATNDDVVVVLDEAHESAGDGETSMQAAFMMGGTIKRGKGANKTEITKSGLLNGEGARHPRGGVLYLSATFAKRPDNMPVYYRTDLSRGADNFTQVVEAMTKGGVALQQAITEALAEAGQYTRRERDFTGVSYSMKRVAVKDEAELVRQVDEVTNVLSLISDFSRVIGTSVAASTAMSGSQQTMTDFASIVHNQVSQLLLAAKADAVVDEVLEAHKRGEKPIVALMNTMESFLGQYVDDLGIKAGQPIKLNWSSLLEYALSRTLRASEKLPNGDTEITIVDPAEYGLENYYNRVLNAAKAVNVKFPISPIDYIIQKARAGGVEVGELTGRESGIDYTDFDDGTGTYRKFKRADKNTLVNTFNNGSLAGLLLNASGSTGLSIHASEKFKDQKPRHMIIAQPALDINVFIQTLGRIKRTGIKMLGRYPDGSAYGARYSHLTLPLNSELRPAIMAARKMKSLNANTTGESDSAVKIEAEDLMNRFGNMVVAEYLNRNPDLQSELNLDITENQDGTVEVPKDIARKFTGRMALQPNAAQGEAYAEIVADYRRAIEQAKVTGDYDLEIIVHEDWDATRAASERIVAGTDESSIFTSSVNVESWDMTDSRPTPSGADMLNEFIKENGSNQQLDARWQSFSRDVDERLDALEQRLQRRLAEASVRLGEMNQNDPGYKGLEFEVSSLNRNLAATAVKKARWIDTQRRLDDIIDAAGKPVSLENAETHELDQGMMTQIKFPDITGQLRIAPSAFKMTYLLNRPGGRIYPTLAQFKADGYTQARSYSSLDDMTGDSGGRRERRTILVGSPIRAYGATGGKGKVVRFKSRDGELVTGIMMPRNWNVSNLAEDPRKELADPEAVAQYLNDLGWSPGYVESGESVRLHASNGSFRITAPSARRTGGDIFLDDQLREIVGDFSKSGPRMTAWMERGDIARIAARVMQLTGKRFKGQDVARVRRANGVEESSDESGGRTARPTSALKQEATQAWNRHIEQSPGSSSAQRPSVDEITRDEWLDRIDDEEGRGPLSSAPAMPIDRATAIVRNLDAVKAKRALNPREAADYEAAKRTLNGIPSDATRPKSTHILPDGYELTEPGTHILPSAPIRALSSAPAPDRKAAEIKKVLESMPPIWRDVLKDTWDGMKLDAIAKDRNLSVNAVGNILRMAEGRFRVLMAAQSKTLKPTVRVEGNAVKAADGRPDLAGSGNAAFAAVDQRRARPEEVTHAEMNDLAESLFAADADAAERLVVRWMDSGTTVLSTDGFPDSIKNIVAEASARQAAEMLMTAAAKLLVTDKSLNGGDTLQIARLIDLYRNTGTEQARALNMRYDPHATPEERAAMYVSEALLTPPQSMRNDIKRNPANKERILAQWAQKADNIKRDLRAAGYDIDATFRALKREKELAEKAVPTELKMPLARASGKTRKLVRAVLEGHSWKEAADAAGMTLDFARKAYNAFREAINKTGQKAAEAQRDALLRSAPIQNDFAAAIGLPEWTEDANVDVAPIRTRVTEDLKRERKRKKTGGEFSLHNPVAVADVLNKVSERKSGTFDKLSEFWRASILSGPQTHVVNAVSSSLYGGYEATLKKMGTGALADIARLFGMKPDAASLADLPAMMSATLPAIRESWGHALRSWRAENRFFDAYARGEQFGDSKFKEEAFQPALGGVVGKVMRSISFRAMTAADEFIKSFFARIEVAAEARQIARSEGLTGKQMADRIAEMSIPGSEAWIRALDHAHEVTFQGEIGKGHRIIDQLDGVAKLIERAKSGDFGGLVKGVSHFVFPFVATPLNIFKSGLTLSPMGSLLSVIDAARAYDQKRKGNTEEAARIYNAARALDDLANQIVAWGALYALSSLVKPGDDDDDLPFVTGSMEWRSTAKGERELAYRTAPPQSIRIGDKWYSYRRLDPFASALAFVVDSIKAFQNDQPIDEEWAKVGVQVMNNMTDKTFLQGLSDLMNAVRDPERFGTQWAVNLATGFVPNLIRQPIRSADPYIREKDLPNDMPFFTALGHLVGYGIYPQAAPAKVDVWGKPADKNTGTGGPLTDTLLRLFSPIDQRDASQPDPLDVALLRYNMSHEHDQFSMSAPRREIQRTRNGVTTKFSLSDAEFTELTALSGQAARRALGDSYNRDLTESDVKNIKAVIERYHDLFIEKVYRKKLGELSKSN